MSDKYYEDPLEPLLDEQSDEEFGMPEIRDKYDHGASEEKHGNLKTWTAEDFSSIYVRFYPHLVRHAKRYLSNEVHAEEVVQDAFLYMMTALPEIDTELGVLKFMKWKVRLLALDVIRASPNRKETLVGSFDDEHSAEETDSEIERADDLAVIGAALAKLNPRHREVLIATVYEEKSSAKVAAQMQLSENATRQLVFRARVAFKNALVGEAEIAGKTISEILSIAAKKHSNSVGKVVTTTGILALVLGALVVSQDYFPNPNENLADSIAPSVSRVEVETPAQAKSGDDRTQTESNSDREFSSPEISSEENQIAQLNPVEGVDNAGVTSSSTKGPQRDSQASSYESPDTPSDNNVPSFVNNQPNETYFSSPIVLDAEAIATPTSSGGIAISAQGPGNLSAVITFDISEKRISGVTYVLRDGAQEIYGYPRVTGEAVSRVDARTTITHTSAAIRFIDGSSAVIEERTGLESAVATIGLELDHSGLPVFASLSITENTV